MRALLMIEDCLRGILVPRALNPWKPCLPENFQDVGVSSQLITFLLAGGQMTTNEAEAGVVQRHANRN